MAQAQAGMPRQVGRPHLSPYWGPDKNQSPTESHHWELRNQDCHLMPWHMPRILNVNNKYYNTQTK